MFWFCLILPWIPSLNNYTSLCFQLYFRVNTLWRFRTLIFDPKKYWSFHFIPVDQKFWQFSAWIWDFRSKYNHLTQKYRNEWDFYFLPLFFPDRARGKEVTQKSNSIENLKSIKNPIQLRTWKASKIPIQFHQQTKWLFIVISFQNLRGSRLKEFALSNFILQWHLA